MINLWRPERMNWMDYMVQNLDHVQMIKNLEQIKTNSDSLNVVVDIIQNNSSCKIEEILEYNKIFDRIVLINCETRPDILQIIPEFDFEKVHFLTIGHIHYTPKHIKIVNIETFFGEIRKLYHRSNYAGLADLKPLQSKNLYFDALLGKPKPHRNFVYQKIQANYQNKIYTRRLAGDVEQSLADAMSSDNWHWPPGAKIIPETDTSIWGSENQVQFADMTTNVSNIVPVDIYNNTCYSIITETGYSADFVMLTEKTAKPLIAKRLFVMFAGPGYLAHLHRLGFQTFDCVIDESYDLEPNNNKRWASAFKQIEYLCNQSQEVILQKIQTILEHNYNLFVSRDWNQEYEKAIATAITDF
jgi:hypothetical protein